jgi:hypothetical protein
VEFSLKSFFPGPIKKKVVNISYGQSRRRRVVIGKFRTSSSENRVHRRDLAQIPNRRGRAL